MPNGPHPSIVMTPPQGERPASSHPRRAPANRSVSLLHSPRKRPPPPNDPVDPTRGDSEGTDDSPSSLQPLGGKGSSGESSSNADKWFEKSNNDVQDNSTSFADNEPPYFLRNNSSSSDTSPERRQQGQQLLRQKQLLEVADGTGSLPLRAGLLHLGTDGSSTDDFRGVIDDLTIENKKLKRKLKKYEKLHDSHLKDEKLFEVRIHGLPPEKKRELEETLRKFAGSLQPSEFPANGYEGLVPLLKTHRTASSQTSMHNTDSAYASMSASGQGSSSHSGTDARQKNPAGSAARQQSIHSYLHHIPEGLLPQQNPATMTERAKKKLVVRRLEQIFAGKGATSEGHQQPEQQQEVSQSAARADRSAIEARGQAVRQEGNREAHIMDKSAEEGGRTGKRPAQPDHEDDPRTAPVIGGKDFATMSSPHALEQRPTRPLDLDPHRAQVPADNIRYMRHLGFSPPEPGVRTGLEDGHGWIYLNFLINMAQLHTINVTSDFVRKAIGELSAKFEISEDGRKVRWKGANGLTRSSSDAGSSLAGAENTPGQSPRKRPKLSHRHSNKSAGGTSIQPGAASAKESNRFAYTPLFFHKDSTDEGDDSSSEEEEEEDESALYPGRPVAGDSSGMTSSGVRTTSTKKSKKAEEGPIIFYNNARFCTDLSGERKPTGGNPNAPPYNPFGAHPIGKPRSPSTRARESEKRGPLANASELPEAMDLGDNPIPESMEIAFPPSSPLDSDSSAGKKSVNLEVTGIGGVWPTDHFAIDVQSRHARVDHTDAIAASQSKSAKRLPPRFAEILGSHSRGNEQPAVHKQVMSSNRRDLLPSQLPPALSFMPFGDESLSDDESEADEDMSISPESPGAFPPSAAPQAIDMQYGDSGEESEGEDEDDDESEGSLDLLAAAREVDPEAVRAREREYDANMADRLAEEIPAGSSAATAGGGSGYASPASDFAGQDVAQQQYQKAKRNARPRPASLKRTRTTDSMRVQGQAGSDDEDDGEGGSDEEMEDAKS